MESLEEPMQEPMQEPVGSDVSDLVDAAAPFHLLRPSQDHRALEANPEAMRYLESLGPVSVLSVVGNQRGGKSTLMNLLHSRGLSGFQMGHFMDPQTTGVWVWPKRHPRRQDLTILLVDSEGLDSPHVPQHYNWLVSAVTLLLSDVFMYQTKGSIEQSSAERLDMILRVTEQLGRAGGEVKQGEKTGCVFLWLLRDHQLQMKHSPKEELVEKLDPTQVRSLKQGFRTFDCVPLPRPAGDEVLRHMDEHSFQDLSTEFREEFVVLERRILELLAEPRQLFGQGITGPGLAEVLRQYLVAIGHRKGVLADICDMPTQSQLIAQLAAKRALAAGLRKYEERLSQLGLRAPCSKLPVQPVDLLAAHNSARLAALGCLEIEAAGAGLSADELKATNDLLEDQLACWDTQLRIVECSAGSDTAADGGHGALAINTPLATQVSTLKGGRLGDLWRENAQRSRSEYEAWLNGLMTLKAEVLASCNSRAASSEEASAAIVEFYSKLLSACSSAEGVDAGRFGPWLGALHSGGGGQEWRKLVVCIMQQGDELVQSFAERALSTACSTLQDKLELQEQRLTGVIQETKGELLDGQTVATAGLKRLSDSIKEISERTAEDATKLRQEFAKGDSEVLEQADAAAGSKLGLEVQALRTEFQSGIASLEERLNQYMLTKLAANEQTIERAVEAVDELRLVAETRSQQIEASLKQAVEETAEALRTVGSNIREELHRDVQGAEAQADERCLELRNLLDELRTSVQETQSLCADGTRQLDEQRDRLAASETKLIELELAGAETSSRLAAVDLSSLEARLETRLARFETRLTELGRASSQNEEKARETLKQKIQEVVARLEESLGRHGQSIEGQLNVVRAEAMAALAAAEHAEAESSRVQRSIKDEEVRQDTRCKELLEGLMGEAFAELELRSIRPLSMEVAALRADSATAAEELQKFNEFVEKSDYNTMWNTFGAFAERLTDIQQQVDDLPAILARKAGGK